MKNNNEKFEVIFYSEDLHDETAKYSVVVSKYKGRWVFCRHKDRTTLEVPGGHIERGETPDMAASRELYEETGAVSYDLKRVCTYGVKIDGAENYGVLYYADIFEMGELPDLEIAETIVLDGLPKNLTYPHIQPHLFYFVNNYIKKTEKLKSKEYKALLFDLDGTLFDNFGAMDKSLEEYYNSNSEFHNFSFDKFKKLYQNISDKYFDMFRTKELSWKSQRICRMKALYSHFGMALDDDTAYEKFLEYIKLYEKHWALLDDAETFLTELKNSGYKLGMITNGELNQQIKKMESQNIIHFFDFIAASSEYDFSKPDAEIFDFTLEKLGVKSEEALFVGDSIRSDIKGANNAQIDSVYVLRSHNKHYEIEYEPTYTIHNLNEILNIIKRIEK